MPHFHRQRHFGTYGYGYGPSIPRTPPNSVIATVTSPDGQRGTLRVSPDCGGPRVQGTDLRVCGGGERPILYDRPFYDPFYTFYGFVPPVIVPPPTPTPTPAPTP